MLAHRLRDPVESVRRRAGEQIVQLGSPATSWVIGAMHDPNAVVRRLACSILPRTVPEKADQAVAALVTAARDSDASVRAAAVEQLGPFVSSGPLRTGAASREAALRAICAALEDKAARVRNAAGLALWNLGPLANLAVVDLDRALDGPDRSLRVLAAMTLLKINDRDANNVPQSRLSLRERTSFRGAKGDNDFRPAPKRTDSRLRVAAAMTSLLADHSDSFNHWRAVHTLKGAIGEEALAAKLVSFLKDQDTTVRHGAMDDLKTHCPTAAAATAGVKDALGSPDGMIRCDAAAFAVVPPCRTRRGSP